MRLVGGRALLIAAGAIAIACVLAGPTAYSLSTVARSIDGTFATAGPEAATRFAFQTDAGDASGGESSTPSGTSSPVQPGRFGEQVDKRLVNFLLANKGAASFLVAVQGALVAAPLILATG